MPAEDDHVEKHWEKMLKTIIDDNYKENTKNMMPSLFKDVIKKYVSQKF